MNTLRTPVVVFAFNRPEKLRLLFDVFAMVQPSTLLVVADGPRSDHPDDAGRCREVRRLLERIDWPCEVLRDYSETNHGCDLRVPAGIDWAFEHVDEAILLEDDLLPHPSFFSWCEEMLDRYRDSDAVHCISGRNNLGRWGAAGDDHHLIFGGSNWGCATWRRAWLRARAVSLPGPDDAIPRLLAGGRIDHWVARHLEMFRGLASLGMLHGWDSRWELQRGLLGGLSAIPPVNLVAHTGFDAEATHMFNPDSLLSVQPVGCAPRPNGRMNHEADHRLDRWSLFIGLLDTYRDPRMLRLVSRSQVLGIDDRLRHHLGPFTAPADSLGALRHLREHGAHSARIDTLIAVFEGLAPQAGTTGVAP